MDERQKRKLLNWLYERRIDSTWREDYSGRGMGGRVSPLAFVCDVHPNSEMGRKIRDRKVNGEKVFTYDSMGMDYIYYVK